MPVTVTTFQQGDGKSFPGPGETCTIHYHGKLKECKTTFDSSINRGEPIVVPIGVGQVIKGWDDGVMQMSLGEKAWLDIPSGMGVFACVRGSRVECECGPMSIKRIVFEVPPSAEDAYGANGAPPTIPPNADLLFEVHLLKIEKD